MESSLFDTVSKESLSCSSLTTSRLNLKWLRNVTLSMRNEIIVISAKGVVLSFAVSPDEVKSYRRYVSKELDEVIRVSEESRGLL